MTKPFCIDVKAPSNIALIKYWGKADEQQQWPSNDSLSMTLKKSVTRTIVAVSEETDTTTLLWCGKEISPTDKKAAKGLKHVRYLREKLGFDEGLRINTRNNFPTGAGIASSASGLAALTIAATAAWTRSKSMEELAANGFERPRLAALARMGSGSAGRSLYGGFVHWQKTETAKTQTITQFDDGTDFKLSDIVILIAPEEKSISSSKGHQSATQSPLFEWRQALLPDRTAASLDAIRSKNWNTLGPLIEQDALEMHAIMMTSPEGVQYFNNTTTQIISYIAYLRRTTDLQCYTTLDAGPNPHVMVPLEQRDELIAKISQAFPGFPLIVDETGTGPTIDMALPY